MNLYLLEHARNSSKAVVAARNEEDAKKTHPSGKNTRLAWSFGEWAYDPDFVSAELLGKAITGTPPGVIAWQK